MDVSQYAHSNLEFPGPTISREEDGIENMEANTGMLRYNTVSNKVRVIRTPGGEHRYLHIKKRGTSPKCGDCGKDLPGIAHLRPKE